MKNTKEKNENDSSHVSDNINPILRTSSKNVNMNKKSTFFTNDINCNNGDEDKKIDEKSETKFNT